MINKTTPNVCVTIYDDSFGTSYYYESVVNKDQVKVSSACYFDDESDRDDRVVTLDLNEELYGCTNLEKQARILEFRFIRSICQDVFIE